MSSSYRRIPLFLLLLLSSSQWLLVHSKKQTTTQEVDTSKLRNRTIERLVELRTHSIAAPYIDQDLQNRWWDFGADAYINTNAHVRLTRAIPSQTGWLWSRLPITAPNFEIVVEFKISGDSSHLYGDGLAMWLTTTRALPGPIFGFVDKWNGLAVIADTYSNARHTYAFPRVMASMGDGARRYDLENDGEGSSLGGCSPHIRRTNIATKFKLSYMKEDGWLDLKIQYKAWDEWTPCFTLYNITLPTSPYLGFSAITGDVADNHDIISVTTSVAYLSPLSSPKNKLTGTPRTSANSNSNSNSNSDPYADASSSQATSEGGGGVGGFFWWLIKWSFIAGLIYVAYLAYLVYKGEDGEGGFGGGGGGGERRFGGRGAGGGVGVGVNRIGRELGRFAARFDTKRF